MKQFILSTLMLVATFPLLGANVRVIVSGLEDSDSATLSIASYSYLETMSVSKNGEYSFADVPAGTHYVKIEAKGYEASPSQSVIVDQNGGVVPATALKLVVTKQNSDPNNWSFKWEEDGSPAGYTHTSHVNKPAEIEFLGKKIVPADVPSFTVLEKDYHIYLDNGGEPWTQEYAYRMVETLKTLPAYYENRKYAVFKLTGESIADDIKVTDAGEGYEVLISKDVFYYANPFLVNLDGVRGRLFSKRLHHALTNFVTDFGKDEYIANEILRNRFGCQILNVNYEDLTQGITNENEHHFQMFIPSEIVSIINMFEEMPEGFHVTPHLNYLIRRINGMPHPLYPDAAAVAWPVDNGYIEFMESAFGGNNQNFETLRLILHEKSHFLWAFTFSDEIKNDWIEIGGWYKDPNAGEDGWSTTKDVEFVSAYAHAHNPDEDMAESIAFYLKDPEKLQSRALEKYEFIRDRIMHGTRYISKIPDHLTFEVLNLFPDYDYPGKIKSLKVSSVGAEDEDKTVTVEIELNNEEGYDDSASGAYVRITSPEFIGEDGTKISQFRDIRMSPIDETGHVLRGSVEVSKYSKTGHWTAGDIIVDDLQGNQRFEGRNDCVFDLFINNSLEDLLPPKYNKDMRYILSDTIVDGHKAQNLQVRFKASDNIGFSRILARLNSDNVNYSYQQDGYYDSATGDAVIDFLITEYFHTGNYWISAIHIWDLAGTETNVWFTESTLDYPTQKIYISTPNPDYEHAELDLQRITVYAEPTHPEAPDGETLVTINYYARDDKSGLGISSYILRDPQGITHFQYHYHRNFYTKYFDGDPTVWERYTIKCVLPQGSAPGIWGLQQMTFVDKAYNEYTYNFVETLIFEPDDNLSDYELFTDITDSTMLFGVNSTSGANYGFKWRIIHEDSGIEINGNSNSIMGANSPLFKKAFAPSQKASNQVSADLTGMPGGDLILIVEVLGEDSQVVSVKTKRVQYAGPVVKAESIILTPSEWEGFVGGSFSISATVLPEDTTDKTVNWTSSDESIATVSADGTVTAVSVGEATITATCGEASATCKVIVKPILIETLIIDPESWRGIEGESFKITATVKPDNATNKILVWETSNPLVAKVDNTGLVTVLKAGTCIVAVSTADGSNLKAECHITGRAGIDEILPDSTTVDVYTAQGILLERECNKDKLKNLAPGVYIIRNGNGVTKTILLR